MSKNLLTLDNRDVFKPFVNDFIGFEKLFNRMNDVFNTEIKDNFPPYDIYQENVYEKEDDEITDTDTFIRIADTHTFIRIALAGFSKEDIGVKFENNILTINDKDVEKQEPERKYIRKGISERHFCIQKTISNDLELVGAKWDNGCLIIEFKPINKEEKKSEYIEIQ